MRTNCVVTVWHLNPDGMSYEKSFYNAHVFLEHRLSKGGLRQMSYHSGTRASVRIMLSDNPEVSLGDYVSFSKSYDAVPDRIKDLKVTRLTENGYGQNAHLRLFCGKASERS